MLIMDTLCILSDGYQLIQGKTDEIIYFPLVLLPPQEEEFISFFVDKPSEQMKVIVSISDASQMENVERSFMPLALKIMEKNVQFTELKFVIEDEPMNHSFWDLINKISQVCNITSWNFIVSGKEMHQIYVKEKTPLKNISCSIIGMACVTMRREDDPNFGVIDNVRIEGSSLLTIGCFLYSFVMKVNIGVLTVQYVNKDEVSLRTYNVSYFLKVLNMVSFSCLNLDMDIEETDNGTNVSFEKAKLYIVTMLPHLKTDAILIGSKESPFAMSLWRKEVNIKKFFYDLFKKTNVPRWIINLKFLHHEELSITHGALKNIHIDFVMCPYHPQKTKVLNFFSTRKIFRDTLVNVFMQAKQQELELEPYDLPHDTISSSVLKLTIGEQEIKIPQKSIAKALEKWKHQKNHKNVLSTVSFLCKKSDIYKEIISLPGVFY